MRHLLSIFFFAVAVFMISAKENTIIITEGSLGVKEQSWFSGGTFPGDKIKSAWDAGKRIHAAAYTNKGWFIVMAKGTGYTMQSYKTSTSWPREWVKQKWDEDYYITDIAYGDGTWLVVMSQSPDFSGQSTYASSWNNLQSWLKEKSDENYFITSMAHDGSQWRIVVSKTKRISSQGYLFATSLDELKSKIKEKVYNRSYRVHQMQYGDGEYFVTYGNYATDRTRSQNYWAQCPDAEAKKFIDERWNDSQDIAYVGGGLFSSPSTSGSNYTASRNTTTTNRNTSNNNNNNKKNFRTDLGNGNYTDYTWGDDGKLYATSHMQCLWCHGTKVCGICHGNGGIYGRAYGGTWYPCKSCLGNGVCSNCKGQGYIVSVSVTNPDGSGNLVSSNGYSVQSLGGGHIVNSPHSGTSVYEGKGSRNSGSSARSSSSSRSSCPKCHGRRFESTAYDYAAASTSGWMQPYHHTGGKCSYCSRVGDHYHYPCSECQGHGQIKN